MLNHIGSRDFGCCLMFAMKMAEDRASASIDVRDFLAGIYVVCLDKLSKYWGTWEEFEELVATECGVTEPRFSYWASMYSVGGLTKKYSPGMLSKERTPELNRVWTSADQFAEQRGVNPSVGRAALAPEDFLLALADHTEIDLGSKLVRSGLQVERLREAVKTLRPRP